MSPQGAIRIGKAWRFSKMAGETLFDLLSTERTLLAWELEALEEAEEFLEAAIENMERVL